MSFFNKIKVFLGILLFIGVVIIGFKTNYQESLMLEIDEHIEMGNEFIVINGDLESGFDEHIKAFELFKNYNVSFASSIEEQYDPRGFDEYILNLLIAGCVISLQEEEKFEEWYKNLNKYLKIYNGNMILNKLWVEKIELFYEIEKLRKISLDRVTRKLFYLDLRGLKEYPWNKLQEVRRLKLLQWNFELYEKSGKKSYLKIACDHLENEIRFDESEKDLSKYKRKIANNLFKINTLLLTYSRKSYDNKIIRTEYNGYHHRVKKRMNYDK